MSPALGPVPGSRRFCFLSPLRAAHLVRDQLNNAAQELSALCRHVHGRRLNFPLQQVVQLRPQALNKVGRACLGRQMTSISMGK